jgi:hypothetical protein
MRYVIFELVSAAALVHIVVEHAPANYARK